MKENKIGEIVNRSRTEMGMTQDEFGAKYEVSGPAIFKFEKGYVRPSLRLWLPMAKDAGIDEAGAVIRWVRTGLPEKYQHYVTLGDFSANGARGGGRGKNKKAVPRGLKMALGDEEFLAVFKPTDGEIARTQAFLAQNGSGNDATAREVFRLVRQCGRG